MKKHKRERSFITARVTEIHRSQLEELASIEGRTKSSMIRCLIKRAYIEHIKNRDERHNEMD